MVNFWKAGSSGKFTMRRQAFRGPAAVTAPFAREPFHFPPAHEASAATFMSVLPSACVSKDQ